MDLSKVIENKIYPKWTTIGIILLLISYEGKSISTSQMYINVKHAILEPGKKHLFLDISSINIDALFPLLYQCFETCNVTVF
jgi:hypothetical protein